MDNERTPRSGYPWSAWAVAVWLYGNAPALSFTLMPATVISVPSA